MRILTAILLGSMLHIASAEAQYRHEFSTGVGFGRQNLKYSGAKDSNLGYSLGVGYDYFFTEHIGLGTGVELATYKGSISLLNFNSVEEGLRDYQNDIFHYNSKVTGYSEEQHVSLLNIPLMLRLQTSGTNKFFLSVGGVVGIPIVSTYRSMDAAYFNTGEFPDRGVTLEDPQFMGFGTFTDRTFKGDVGLATGIIAAAETGMKWNIGKSWSLYTGAYASYGLTNMGKTSSKSAVRYNMSDPEHFKQASILESSHFDNGAQSSFTSKVTPLSFGLKLRVAFGKGSASKRTEAVATPIKHEVPEHKPEEVKPPVIEVPKDVQLVADMEDKLNAEAVAEREKAEAQKQEAKAKIATPVSGYALNDTGLSQEKKAELDEKIALLKKYPELSIKCVGHTCNTGSNGVNERTGLKRAEAAKVYMVQNSIEESRITIVSKGKYDPLVPNTSRENRSKNRRVEFIIQDK